MGAILEFVAFSGVACGCLAMLGYFIERRTDR